MSIKEYHMFNKLIPFIIALFLIGCAGSFTSQVAPGYRPPFGKEIALTYLDHADINISNNATSILEEQLRHCRINDFLTAEETTNLLQNNKIELPRRLTEQFIQSLRDVIPVKYLLTGGVSVWKRGGVGFPMASSTEVSASFTMFDLTTGKVVWTASGQEEGAAGILAEDPSSKAKTVFHTMLKKWSGFCTSY